MSRNFAHLLMLVSALIWGTTFIAQTTGMNTLGPLSFTGARYWIGVVAILPFALFEVRKTKLLDVMAQDKRVFHAALGLGVLMFGGIALQQTALLYTKVANAAFLTALYVPFVPLITWLINRSPVTVPIWIAVLLSLIGSYLLSGGGQFDAQMADILVAIGALFWAGHIILIGYVTKLVDAPLQLAFLQNIVCAALASLGAFSFESPEFVDFLPAWQELIYAGAISVGIAYTLQLVAQRYAHATTSAFLLSLEAVFAVIAGWMLLSQQVSVTGIIGCSLIFCAVLLADVLPASWRDRVTKYLRFSKR